MRRRTVLASALGIGGGLLLPGIGAAHAARADLSRAVVESTMARSPDPASLGGWGYTQGLFLLGAYRVYQRVKEPSYLAYIKRWVDRFVDVDGHMSRTFDNLDAMQAGNLLLVLHRETGDARYRTAADQIRARFATYPRTADGGMRHTRTTRSPGTSRCTSATSRRPTG